MQDRLSDRPRPGWRPRITAEQVCRIVALTCEAPEFSGRPITQWTGREIAAEVVRRGIVDHISPRVATGPEVLRWHFVADNLDIHLSESLVCWVAVASGVETEPGRKGTEGVLKNRASRKAFLSDPSHKVVFHYTPKHSSWMNQMEI